jgi:hypothetical protein
VAAVIKHMSPKEGGKIISIYTIVPGLIDS